MTRSSRLGDRFRHARSRRIGHAYQTEERKSLLKVSL